MFFHRKWNRKVQHFQLFTVRTLFTVQLFSLVARLFKDEPSSIICYFTSCCRQPTPVTSEKICSSLIFHQNYCGKLLNCETYFELAVLIHLTKLFYSFVCRIHYNVFELVNKYEGVLPQQCTYERIQECLYKT